MPGDWSKKVSGGERIDSSHPIASAARANLLTQVAQRELGVGPPRDGKRRSGRNGVGSTARRAILYDDLTGYLGVADNSVVKFSPGLFRCLPLARNGSSWDLDPTASVVMAEPTYGALLTLSETGCCSEGGEGGLRITLPITDDNLIEDDEATAVVISGAGVDPASAVNATFPSPVGVVACTVAADGTWTTGPVDITGLSVGTVSVTVAETDVDSFVHKARRATFTFAKAFTPTDLSLLVATPLGGPDLVVSSDTGASATDNRTSDTTPTLQVQSPESGVADIKPRLYANGVLVASLDELTFQFTNFADLTASVLSEGEYDFTYTLQRIDTSLPGGEGESGHSPPLRVIISSDATTLGVEITATCKANGVYTTSTDPVPVDTVVITNTGTDPDPAAPVSVAQPQPKIAGEDDDDHALAYLDSVWEFDSGENYAREVVLQTIGGVETIVGVSPCRRKITYAERHALGL